MSGPGRPRKNPTASDEVESEEMEHLEAQASEGQKVFMRSAAEFRHDLYKLEVAVMKKNVSWQKKRPMIENVEHTHIFHSHSSRGKKLNRSTAQGGHFHYIEESVDAKGQVSCKVGPPMKEIDRPIPGGNYVREIVQVGWDTGTGRIVDNHAHPITYMGSEMISGQRVAGIQAANAAGVAKAQADEGASA